MSDYISRAAFERFTRYNEERYLSIEGKISEVKEDIGELKVDFKTMEKTLIEISHKLDKVVDERKWYKAAAGFV
ncbi:hypothetical protein M5S04_12635, partial [Avibacterium paragallinarum]